MHIRQIVIRQQRRYPEIDFRSVVQGPPQVGLATGLERGYGTFE